MSLINTKFVYTDLDDTIITSKKEPKFLYKGQQYKDLFDVPKEVQEAFEKLIQKGINTGIATGRDYRKVYPLLAKTDMFNLPTITDDGACVFINNKCVKATYIDKKVVNRFIQLAKKFKNISYTLNTPYGVYVSKNKSWWTLQDEFINSKYPNKMFKLRYVDLTKVNHFYNDQIVSMTISTKPIALKPLNPREVDYFIDLSSFGNVHVTKYKQDVVIRPNESKASGIFWVKNNFNNTITKDNTMCFGDNHNDVDMFKWSNLSVAVDNAKDVYKSFAKYQADDCQNFGVAKFINQHLLD
ncbi:HAD family hydrolase [Mycoplasma sp. E35C]|uniref:HAD-IIB family hydrolase n=1 Tax=Mycoplasma sp. E35C TaxID=2801918 RepID=UPI001CA3A64F|nr:HAD family hydrolase [Mycoplasma sp. E35C]QZX49361.1 HAD family phosphatase [Mycoplasma sp. E35C]